MSIHSDRATPQATVDYRVENTKISKLVEQLRVNTETISKLIGEQQRMRRELLAVRERKIMDLRSKPSASPDEQSPIA